MTAGNVVEFEAALAGEAAIRPVAEREAKTILGRLGAGRADFLGDAYEMPDADRAQMAKKLLDPRPTRCATPWRLASTAGSTTTSHSSGPGASASTRSAVLCT